MARPPSTTSSTRCMEVASSVLRIHVQPRHPLRPGPAHRGGRRPAAAPHRRQHGPLFHTRRQRLCPRGGDGETTLISIGDLTRGMRWPHGSRHGQAGYRSHHERPDDRHLAGDAGLRRPGNRRPDERPLLVRRGHASTSSGPTASPARWKTPSAASGPASSPASNRWPRAPMKVCHRWISIDTRFSRDLGSCWNSRASKPWATLSRSTWTDTRSR